MVNGRPGDFQPKLHMNKDQQCLLGQPGGLAELDGTAAPIMNVLVIDMRNSRQSARYWTGRGARVCFRTNPDAKKDDIQGSESWSPIGDYGAVSVGYPGSGFPKPAYFRPVNLGKGWAGFNFEAAF